MPDPATLSDGEDEEVVRIYHSLVILRELVID